ncbi:TRAP transporter substrate-binding protein [Alcaligenes pakistanensis]
MKKIVLTSLALGSLALGSATMAQELPKTSLKVVGGLSNLTAYQNTEQPFWAKKVPELSGGQITADIKGFNDMGLKGPEIMRLISQGVIPFGTATLAYFASDNSINEAIDLAGLAPDIEVAKKLTDAFTPAYEQFYAKSNVKVLGFSTYPAQVLFCNGTFNGLSDLKGKKVRTSSRTQAEFVQALGGNSVTIPFGEVVPALQNGVVDCAITGSMSGYSAKWYEVSSKLYEMPINWNQQIHAANLGSWNKLDPKVQEFLASNIKAMTEEIWAAAAKETQEGYDCNTGADTCTQPLKGKMTLVKPTDADRELLKKVMSETVVPKWAERSAADTVAAFNTSLSPILGFEAKK